MSEAHRAEQVKMTRAAAEVVMVALAAVVVSADSCVA